MACEKCWQDARELALYSGLGQWAEYARLLEERKDNPCTPAQERGGNQEYSDASMLEADEWDSELIAPAKILRGMFFGFVPSVAFWGLVTWWWFSAGEAWLKQIGAWAQ